VCDVLQNDRKLTVLWLRRQILITVHIRLLQPKISDLSVSQVSSFTTADIEQKGKCFSMASGLLKCAETNQNFLKNFITRDETWENSYYSETKQQSSKQKTPSSQ
jgi:hypothetical protein